MGARPRKFQTTRWSLVFAAGGATTPRARQALAELCRLYWHPLYAFVRRSGYPPDQALDHTQGFFTDLLGRKDLSTADPERGRFRSWLLGCLKHYLLNRLDHDTAQKRGGPWPNAALSEQEYARGPVDDVTPEKLYLRRWTMSLLAEALAELRAERVRAGTVARFDRLQPYLLHEGTTSIAQLAAELSMTEGAVRQAIFNLRECFRHKVRTAIAATVTELCDIDGEISELMAALA